MKPSPLVSRLSSALAKRSGATVRIADSRPATARSQPLRCWMSPLQVHHHVDELAPDAFHIRNGAVDLGIGRQLEIGWRLGGAGRRIRHIGGRHGLGFWIGLGLGFCHRARHVATRHQRLLQADVFPLQAVDLAFQRRALLGSHGAGPAGRRLRALGDLAGDAVEPDEGVADAVEAETAGLARRRGHCLRRDRRFGQGLSRLSLGLGPGSASSAAAPSGPDSNTRPATTTTKAGRIMARLLRTSAKCGWDAASLRLDADSNPTLFALATRHPQRRFNATSE